MPHVVFGSFFMIYSFFLENITSWNRLCYGRYAVEFMSSVEDDDDVLAEENDESDNDVGNESYVRDDIQAEVSQFINNAIDQMNAGETSDAFIASTLKLSLDDAAPSASSTINDVGAYVVLDNVDLVSSEEREATSMEEVEVEVSAQDAEHGSTVVAEGPPKAASVSVIRKRWPFNHTRCWWLQWYR